MKADEIQDILTLQGLLADQGHNEAAEDPETLAALVTWKYGGNGVVVDSDTTARRKSPPLTEPKRGPGRPKASAANISTTRAPAVAKAAASVDDPDF